MICYGEHIGTLPSFLSIFTLHPPIGQRIRRLGRLYWLPALVTGLASYTLRHLQQATTGHISNYRCHGHQMHCPKPRHHQTMRTMQTNFLAFCVTALVITSCATPIQQNPLMSIDKKLEGERVRGHSEARYGPVPKADQLFNVEFLEIAPTPIKA